jgi:hypothetical protein
MQENNKTYRIHTKVREDKFLNVNLNQDVEQLEILSLKLDVENFYKLHTSDYGCLVGRVLANKGVGIPNVKISVFIPVDNADLDNPVFRYLYPYTNTKTRNQDGIRYNLLQDVVDDKCHQDIGTFPNKRLVLDDSNVIEVFDKYFKYTTVSNAAGDYMLFGLPVGNNIIHSELDLSDIGILSQKPRDLYYKGYTHTQFENSNQFKKDTNLDYLTQVIVQDNSVQVYPFWGDDETDGYNDIDSLVKITRSDIDINYKFEPTCIFIGSLVADDKSNGFSKKCTPTDRSGKMDRLTTGAGTIEMIRKTPSGKVESFSIQGNDLIDGNGTWCYQIPMNLDYMKTDEYGNFVPAENEMTGIPTRTRVRFRVSLADYESDSANAHLPKVLIPNNPTLSELQTKVDVPLPNGEVANIPQGPDYNFGTYTREESYRDLFWNNVYTVKEYIPRIQNIIVEGRHVDRNKNFSGIKAVNVNGSNNPIPYNNLRVNLTFLFVFQCIIFKAVVLIVKVLNRIIYFIQKVLDALSCRGKYKKGAGCSCECGTKCDAHLLYITLDGSMCPTMEGYQLALGAENKYGGDSALRLIDKTCSAGRSGGTTMTGGWSWQKGGSGTLTVDQQPQSSTNTSVDRNPNNIDTHSSDSKYSGVQLPDFYSTSSKNVEAGVGSWVSENMVSADGNYFVKCVELQFAMEYEVIQFDFYNDWINGLIYLPRWFAELKRRKRVDYVNACNENYGGERELVQQCAVLYNEDGTLLGNGNCESMGNEYNCHRRQGRYNIDVLNRTYTIQDKSGNVYVYPDGGIIQTFKNQVDDRFLYYLRPSKVTVQTDGNNRPVGLYSYTPIKANLFATDIVLLGNVLDCNRYGIPTATGYPSSTFIMPPPTGQIVSDSQEMNMYFNVNEDYKANETDYFITQNKRLPNDDTYEQTQIEMSGIDWGYNPFKVGKDDSTLAPQTQQGGHFLEIGCVAADVTPKSCINLQRICELGSEMSQSHFYSNPLNDKGYFIGTKGVVSGREVIGEDIRTKFAALNSNRLETIIDEQTGYLKYKLIGYTPYNFNGALANWQMMYDASNNFFLGNSGENYSRSYIAFRFAENIVDADSMVGTTVNLKNKFLKQVGNQVYTMPVYENSLYFYFGLKDGNTAIDRLYTEYFSECTTRNSVEDGSIIMGKRMESFEETN